MPLLPQHRPGNGKKKLPSLARRAVNFSKAAIHHVKTGRKKRSTNGQLSCKAICRENHCGLYLSDVNKCAHKNCGCNLDLKISWADTKCPVGLWGPENLDLPIIEKE